MDHADVGHSLASSSPTPLRGYAVSVASNSGKPPEEIEPTTESSDDEDDSDESETTVKIKTKTSARPATGRTRRRTTASKTTESGRLEIYILWKGI